MGTRRGAKTMQVCILKVYFPFVRSQNKLFGPTCLEPRTTQWSRSSKPYHAQETAESVALLTTHFVYRSIPQTLLNFKIFGLANYIFIETKNAYHIKPRLCVLGLVPCAHICTSYRDEQPLQVGVWNRSWILTHFPSKECGGFFCPV
jgi:hypothetical protein